jgi:hypothetical protein
MIIPLRSSSTPMPAVTEPTPLARNQLHLFTDFWIIRWTITPNSFGIDAPSRDIAAQHPAGQ